MFKNCVKSKNVKFIDDNEFASNHWQCILHFKKINQVKKSEINDDREVKYNVTMF